MARLCRITFAILALVLAAPGAWAQSTHSPWWGSTRANYWMSRALTDAGFVGVPRYPTVSLPTCDASNVGAVAFDSTATAFKVCNGTAWGLPGIGGSGTAGQIAVFSDATTLGGVSPTDDRFLIGSGTAWTATAAGDCDIAGTSALTYDTTLNAIGCNAITAAGVGAANTALSNLAAVAINTAPLPAASGTLALGSDTLRWASAYLGGNTLGTGGAATSTPPLHVTQTWNTTSALTAMLVNVTNTASDAASRLLSLGVGGGSYVEKFGVETDGDLLLGSAGIGGATITGLSTTGPLGFTTATADAAAAEGFKFIVTGDTDDDADTPFQVCINNSCTTDRLLRLKGDGALFSTYFTTALGAASASARFDVARRDTGVAAWSIYSAAGEYALYDAAGTPGNRFTIDSTEAGRVNVLNEGVLSRIPVEANTGTKTPTVAESGELYTNTGDADGSAVTLPDDPSVGTTYTIAVPVAQTITITATTVANELIYLGSNNCAASLTSNTIGSTVTLTAVVGGADARWFATSYTGTWACND